MRFLSVLSPLSIFFLLFASLTFADEKTVERWTAAEWEFHAAQDWTEAQAFSDVTLDVTFTSEKGTVLVVPAFWDGGNVWRVRFAPTETGIWRFETRCAPEDPGLNGQTGSLKAVPYAGDLEVFRRGFVTTREGLKYFVYADGTPFFYLGDTHWSMMAEEFDEPGPNAGDLKVESHFKAIVDRRVEQGFTVYQSEPIGKKIQFADGIQLSDVEGFQSMDRYFAYIAQAGLTHANAEFFYPSEMKAIENDEAYLERLTRYWAARYAAYPVFWTLGQEVDDDFYGRFSREKNPYVKVCEWLHQYDPYKHPITGHQENAACVGRLGNGEKIQPSLFQNVPGHTWYGVQWSRPLNRPFDLSVPKDFWDGGKGKPAILYEGKYCFLWTKDFGARAQGWYAFLTGLYGYGYGAADIWLYRGTYDMNTTSRHDGVSAVTPEDKAVPWPKALEFPSARQMTLMKQFLQAREWWKLVPEFAGDEMKFVPENQDVFYVGAHEQAARFIFYFYSPGTATGTLQALPAGRTLSAVWFDPQTGESKEPVCLTVAEDGTAALPQKPNEEDWVLEVH